MRASTASRSTKPSAHRQALRIRIVLIAPPSGVTYGLQRGRGSAYIVEGATTPARGNVTFECTVAVVKGRDGRPDFRGEYVQGPIGRRFIYIDVGRYAKQAGTPWSRRMIVRLHELSWPQIEQATKPGNMLEARIEGTGSDGGPSCATVVPTGGWRARVRPSTPSARRRV